MDFIIEGNEADLARLDVSAGRPKDEWKALFVAALALGYQALTRKLPGQTPTSGDFVGFLTAAWASLPGEPPEIIGSGQFDEAFAWLRQSPGRLQNLHKLTLRKQGGFMPTSGAKTAPMIDSTCVCTTVTPFSGSERERSFKTKFILNTKG
jgi:hypothetical protein